MEIRLLVTQALWRHRVCLTLAVSLNIVAIVGFLFGAIDTVQASEKQEIRFYKANRQLQTDLIWFTRKKGRLAGCHNFLKKTRVYLTKQIGFKTCTIYTKKDCASDSELTATRKKDDTLVTKLSEGYTWAPTSEHKRGARIRSWACE